MLHDPVHTSEECKVLKIYSDKYAAQRPHKYKEYWSGRKTKHGKYVKFGNNIQEVKIMETYDDPTPNKNEEKNMLKVARAKV